MSSVGYKVSNSVTTTLTANTPRTCLMFITPAQFGGALRKCRISFTGATAGQGPAFYEIVRSTNATNSTPGTNNTNENSNIVQYKGRTITAGFTAFSASTTEPTVLTVLDSSRLTVVGGSLVWDIPLSDEMECDVSAGLGIRLTTPAAAASVDTSVMLGIERL